LPGWFTALDRDGDGQVGLYEWPKDRPLEEFFRMDRNGDGFITIEEAMRYFKIKEPKPSAAAQPTLAQPTPAQPTPAQPTPAAAAR
jgi:hypothetical protein